jgi:hypothetical protein
MKKFSKVYNTFNEWIVNNQQASNYKTRIARLHGLYPDATLSQLRGHAIKNEKRLSHKPKTPIGKRHWSSLSPKEKLAREKSLEVLSDVRRSKKSLAQACNDRGVSPKIVLKNTGAFKKMGNRWTARSYDKIPRYMRINEDGKEVSIEVNDSRIASLIGRYHNAVKKYLDNGDTADLEQFEGIAIRDAQGEEHLLETDTEALKKIAEAREEPEFYDIYNL